MATLIKSNRDSDIHQLDQDLLLAAEIGKSLLERNRELESVLKSTQDYAEEQAAQVDFYMRQVEILRESNESYSHSCEQLESNNQQLHDKYEQQKAECNILQGKNNRSWEVVGSLEKKIEELTVELNNVNVTLDIVNDEKEDITIEDLKIENQLVKQTVLIENEEFVDNSVCELKHENEKLQKLISELKVMIKVEKWHKEEIESQLEDSINENQMLHHKIANLNLEIREWEKFAEKEENYRRIAEAFSIRHNIESDYDEYSQTATLTQSTKSLISKAKSCEYLNDTRKDQHVLKTPNLVNSVLSSENSSSFLSELDSEYADLVKRYEALLEKCKQEGRFNENPERTRKVQRAIQTLSFDFTKLVSPVTSPVKDMVASTNSTTSTSVCECQKNTDSDEQVDYRKMFADIFAKIKDTKDSCT